MRKTMELASSAVLILIGVVYLIVGTRYPWGKLADPGPGFFPIVIGALFLLGAAVIFISAFLSHRARGADRAPADVIGKGSGSKKLWLLLLFSAFYLFALDWLGHLVGSPLLMLFTTRLMGMKSWWQCLLLAIGATIGTYLVFALWLQMPLPRGIFISGS
jgi:hypothetical protein